MKYFLFFILVFFVSVRIYSQSIISSNTYIRTCIDKTECSSINNASYLFYDENNNTLYLKVDFNTFKSGQDSIDDWLEDLTGTFLFYKVSFPKEEFIGLSNHRHKTLKLNGQVYLNGIWHNQSVDLTLFSTENSIMTSNTNGNSYDDYKVNFSLSLAPKDFKLHKKPHHLRKTIFIGIALGRINLLQSGAQQILGEAYNHH
jgi:hypothetical protein